jgi:hypothetical protein
MPENLSTGLAGCSGSGDVFGTQQEHRLDSLACRAVILALSWDQVGDIARRFETLNPYDHKAVPGSILKIASRYSRGAEQTASEKSRPASRRFASEVTRSTNAFATPHVHPIRLTANLITPIRPLWRVPIVWLCATDRRRAPPAIWKRRICRSCSMPSAPR